MCWVGRDNPFHEICWPPSCSCIWGCCWPPLLWRCMAGLGSACCLLEPFPQVCPWPAGLSCLFTETPPSQGRTWHLSLLNFTWLLLVHSSCLPRCVWMAALSLNVFDCSPCILLPFDVIHSADESVLHYLLWVKMLKTRGHSADPCRTPLVTEHYQLTSTLWNQLFYQFLSIWLSTHPDHNVPAMSQPGRDSIRAMLKGKVKGIHCSSPHPQVQSFSQRKWSAWTGKICLVNLCSLFPVTIFTFTCMRCATQEDSLHNFAKEQRNKARLNSL